MTLEQHIKENIADVHDFPKPGIIYKDITPIFQNPAVSNEILEVLVAKFSNQNIEGVLGLESRGFLFGFPLAMRLGVPFILVRKKGKLPREVYTVTYDLEYGSAAIEVHKDAITSGQRILVHDDVLATGGTAHAAAELVEMAGGQVVGFSFLLELSFLNGRERLSKFSDQLITFAAY